MRQSKSFKDENLTEEILLDKIAVAAFMSKFHYIRAFERIYGMSPRQYLRDKRILRAKELLSEGVSVTDTCFAIGYNSLAAFSRVFKKGTGLSPREFYTEKLGFIKKSDIPIDNASWLTVVPPSEMNGVELLLELPCVEDGRIYQKALKEK